jgi:hypothetical protein
VNEIRTVQLTAFNTFSHDAPKISEVEDSAKDEISSICLSLPSWFSVGLTLCYIFSLSYAKQLNGSASMLCIELSNLPRSLTPCSHSRHGLTFAFSSIKRLFSQAPAKGQSLESPNSSARDRVFVGVLTALSRETSIPALRCST